MQLYNVVNQENSLIHECWKLCDADIISYPLADVIRRFNFSLEELSGLIINADGTWQWDDTNNTDFPVGTYTLVANQAKYSFNDKFLQLLEVQIMDKDGNYKIIPPIDQKEIDTDTPLEETYKTAGSPKYYDLISDDTIKLLPAPAAANCTLASGLKIKFKRTAHLFAIDDTTAEPGLPSTHHVLLAYMAAIPYNEIYHPERIAREEKKIDTMKKTLLEHYSQREKDKRKIMTMRQISYE